MVAEGLKQLEIIPGCIRIKNNFHSITYLTEQSVRKWDNGNWWGTRWMILQSSGYYGEWFGLELEWRAWIKMLIPNKKFDPGEKELRNLLCRNKKQISLGLLSAEPIICIFIISCLIVWVQVDFLSNLNSPCIYVEVRFGLNNK